MIGYLEKSDSNQYSLFSAILLLLLMFIDFHHMLDDNIDQRCLPGGCYMNTQVEPSDVEVEEEPDDWFSRNKLFVFIGCLIFVRWLWGYMGW